MIRAKLLFCGELPPAAINGISVSSSRILRVLAERFDILHVEEKRSLSLSRLFVLQKILRVFSEGVELSLKTLRWRPDFFYTTFPTSVFGATKCLLFILLFRTFGRGRIILHIHRGDLVGFSQRGWLPRFLVKSCFDRVSTILSLSTRQSLAYAELTSTPVLVLANSVDNISQLAWRPPMARRLIFLSNYLPDKGLDTLLDAFKEVRKNWQIELHCYGGGDAGHYRARVESESILDVKIHGVLAEKDKYKVMQDFTLLVFPSYNEGQPLVILEAMSIGLPVVSTDVGLISEMVGDDYPYLVAPRDYLALAKAINSYLASSDPEALGRSLKARFQALYSSEAQRIQIWEAFAVDQQGLHES